MRVLPWSEQALNLNGCVNIRFINFIIHWGYDSCVIQTFGFTFLFSGWTCGGRAFFWCLLLSLLLGSVFFIIFIIVIICVWICTEGNICTRGAFAFLIVDQCASAQTFLLFWNTPDFLFWFLFFSLFCLFFFLFCLLFLYLLSICYKMAVRQCGLIRILVKNNDLCESHFGWHYSHPLKYLRFSWSLSFWALLLFHSWHLLLHLFPLSSFLASVFV